MHVRPILVASLLCLAACGGAATQNNNGSRGDRATGSADRTGRSIATSGGELANNGGATCTIDPVYFAYDSSDLDTRARNILEENGRCLESKRTSALITGLTDDRGTEEYNLALGDRRAQMVARYLTNLGVDSDRLRVASLGEERATGQDEAGWARDRRADMREQ
jgi:peptidoglycan-associated lipoprotein